MMVSPKLLILVASYEIPFVQGYASLAQTDTGLHIRERSRAFIVADASIPSNRFVFVNAGTIQLPM